MEFAWFQIQQQGLVFIKKCPLGLLLRCTESVWVFNILLQKQGVKVFILLYKEIEATLMIKSIYSKQILMGKHENIKVNDELCVIFLLPKFCLIVPIILSLASVSLLNIFLCILLFTCNLIHLFWSCISFAFLSIYIHFSSFNQVYS